MRGIRSTRDGDFPFGRVRSWPDSMLQPSICGPPVILQSTHEAALDVVDQTPRAGTVMMAQIEAVDFFAFDNSYARLPDRFFARLSPTPVAAPRLVRLNKKLAWHLELDPGKLAAPHRRVWRSSGVPGCPKQASRSPWLMPATSSVLSSLNSVTDVQFFSVR